MAKVVSTRGGPRCEKNSGFRTVAGAIGLSLSVAVGAGVASLATVALAQSYSFSSVSVEGNQRVDPATILSYAGIARGQSVSGGQLNDAYQRILGSGLFESVEIVPQGNRLVIRVVEYPTINRITIEGNRRLKDEDLQSVLQSQSRRVFSPSVAEADAQAISEAYVTQGRLAAQVSPKVIRRSNNRVDLVFEVFEGGVSEIERIGIVGNDRYSDRRLRRVLETKQAGLLRAIIRKDTFIEDRVEFDKQLLRDFYQSRGYVDFRITGVNAELAQERDGYFVTFNVEEGQQFRVGAVEVSTDLPEVDPDLFQSRVRLRPGKVYSPALIEAEIARLEKLAIRQGLNFVRVDPRISRNDRDLTLDVEFVLTRGERIFIERIDIEGNTTTLDRVVRRQFEVVEGDPFNPRAIRESAERIRALGFFSDAEVQAREGSTPQQVIIDVDVEEQPTGSLSFGGSYSSTTGFGAAISFTERNFLGRGQFFNFSINTSEDSRSYGLNFVEPALLGRDLALGLALSYTQTDDLGGSYDTAFGVFRPSLEFPISDNGRLQVRYALNYSDIEASSSVGDVINAEAALGERYDSSLGYTYSFDTIRAGISENTRYLFEFGQDFAGLGGDTQHVRTSVRAIAQTRVLSEEVTLRATVEAGALSYSDGQSRVTDRFVIGPNVMRGFDYGGIGPREVGPGVNDALGGDYFAVARFEAEFPIGLPDEYGITGGVFYDVGSVWGLSSATRNAVTTAGHSIVSDGFDARHVVGVSIFWQSVLGPLRMNFSEPVKKTKWDEELNFNLTVSTEF